MIHHFKFSPVRRCCVDEDLEPLAVLSYPRPATILSVRHRAREENIDIEAMAGFSAFHDKG
jgi:hypothetical protein